MKKIYEILNECNKEALLSIISKRTDQEHLISDYKTLLAIIDILPPSFNTVLVSLNKDENNPELHFIRNNEIIFDDMELFSLNEWLGMTVSKKTVNQYSSEYISAIILISMHNQSDEKMISYNHTDLFNYLNDLNKKSLLEHHINAKDLDKFKNYIMRNN